MGIRIPVTQAETSTPKSITAVSPTPSQDLTPRNVVEQPQETPTDSGTGILNIPKKDLDEVFGESMVEPVDSIQSPMRTDVPPKLNLPDYVKDEVFGPMPDKDPLKNEKVLAREIDLKQTKSTKEIAERLNINMDEASAILSQSSVEEIRADIKLKDIEKKHPGLLTWSRNPDNLRLLQQDPDYFLRLSSASKQFDPTWIKKSQNFTKDSINILASGMAQMNAGVLRLGSSVYALGALPQNLIAENFNMPSVRADVPKVLLDNSLTKYYDDSSKYFSQKVDLKPDFFNTLKGQVVSGDYAAAGRNIFLSAIQSAPQQMLTIMGAMSGYSTATLVGMGLLQGTQTLKEGIDSGAPTGKATLNATYAGAFEALMENLGTVGAFKKWEGLIYKQLGKVEGRKVMREFVKTMAYSGAAEFNEEFWTSVGQDASAYSTGVNMKALEGIWGRATGAGILGGVSGTTMTAPSALGSAYYLNQQKNIREGIAKRINKEIIDAQNAKAAKENMEKMREDKKTSSAAKDHPQQTAEFVDTNTNEEDKPQASVKLTVKSFVEYAQKLAEDPMIVAESISTTFAEAYKKAVDNDLPEFEIGLSDYHRNTDDHAELDDIAIFNNNTYNAKEAEEAIDSFEKIFTKAKEEAKAEEKVQRQNMQGGDPTKGPPTDEGNIETVTPDEIMQGDPVLRPIRLLQVNRSEEDKKVFESIRAGIFKATDMAGIDPNVADLMAEMQFNHLRMRSEVLGKSIAEVHKEVNITIDRKLGTGLKDRAIAYFQHTSQIIMPRNKVVFGPLIKANAIVHEFAHSWLHNMFIDYDLIDGIPERTAVQEEYYQAMKETAKMFGLRTIKDLYNDSARSTKIHETFAQTAEKYLLEGNFKESRLRIIFEGMRKWMAQISHIVGKAYPQFPPLKLSPEVQRVFQTITSGSSKAEAQVGEMFPPALFDEAILGANAEAYMKAIMDSRDKAVAEMYFKFFNKSFNEREKLMNAALNAVFDEAEQAIDARPSMLIMRSILSEGDAGRITYESIIEVLYKGDELAARDMLKNIPKKIIAGKKKAGVDVRDIMLQLNITDIEHMKDMLHEMSRRDQMIEDMSNSIMEERFPTFKTDEQIHDEAVMAVNNEGRAKVLAMELKILADEHLKTLQKMSATAVMPPDLIKRKSQEAIKVKSARLVFMANALKLNPWSFQKSASRFGRLAADFVKNGDYLSAFEMKENEAINHFAFRQAMGVQTKIDKYKSDIKRMGKIKPIDMGRVFDADIYQYGQLVLRAITAGKTVPLMDKADYPFTTTTDSDVDAINRLIAEVNTAQEGISPDAMNVQTFLNLGMALKLIRKLAAEQKKIEIEGQKYMTKEIADEISNEIGERRASDPNEEQASNYSAKWDNGFLTLRNFFVGLGVAPDSRILKVLNAVADAEADLNLEKAADDLTLAKAAALVAKDNPEMQSVLASIRRRMIGVVRPERGKPVPAPEVNFIFANKGELLKALLYWGSESGRYKLAMGGLMSSDGKSTGPLGTWDIETNTFQTPELDAMFTRMMSKADGTISKHEMDFVNSVWRINDRHYEAVRKSIRKVQGRNIGKIGGRKISTPWGDYEGGYVALRKHNNMMDQNLTLDAMSVDNPGTLFSELFPFTNTSMANERTEKPYPLSLDLSTIRSDLGAVYKVAYLLPSMHQVGKIFRNEKFQKTLETRRPGAMKDIIEPWFVNTMSQKYLKAVDIPYFKAAERLTAVFRKNMRVLAFLGNIRSMLKQPLGLFPAATVVKAKYLQEAAFQVAVSPLVMREEISKLSPRMKARFLNNEKNAVRDFEDFSMNEDPIAKSSEQVQKATFFLIQASQNFTDTVIFHAAVKHAKFVLKMTSDKEIYDFATNVVIDTQGSTDISQVPQILNSNVFMRLVTDFLPQVITMYGLIRRDIDRNKEAGLYNRMERQAYMLIMTAVLPAIVVSMIDNLDKIFDLGDDDETYEELASSMMAENFRSIVDMKFPVVGRLVVGAIQNPRNPLGGLPVSRPIGQIGRTIAKPLTGDFEYSPKDVYAMLDSITLTTGVPVAVLNRVFKTFIDPNN